jgi:peptide/nickel transport system ATP-binding protein/oligopeptide transport system ATP-binding protein
MTQRPRREQPASGSGSVPEHPLLEVSGLKVSFRTDRSEVQAVRGLDLALSAGESIAVLGESGSGKSVTGKALLGLLPESTRIEGSIRFRGKELVGRPDKELRPVRGEGIGMVFQDALDSLNPVYTIGSQINELLRVRRGMRRRQAHEEAARLLSEVGIPDPEHRLADYPFQFSGGMRQRVAIALAIALTPALLIADEPTTALDVTVQAGILRLINRLRRETGMALLFVTHDLTVAQVVADQVAVMYAGRIVERGPLSEVYSRPAHPYTQALLRSHPAAATHWSQLRPIGGHPPDKGSIPSGCAFHPRCPLAADQCVTRAPEPVDLGADRTSSCHYAQEVLADVS